MSKDESSGTNIIEFRKRYEAKKRQHPYLPEDVDTELGELAAEALRAVLHREIELASMRWARNGALMPIGQTPVTKRFSRLLGLRGMCAGGIARSHSLGLLGVRRADPKNGNATAYRAFAGRVQRWFAAGSEGHRIRISRYGAPLESQGDDLL